MACCVAVTILFCLIYQHVAMTLAGIVKKNEFILTECSPGYTGHRCALKCPYPGYGKECQKVCNCSMEYCDLVSGCLSSECLYIFLCQQT